MTILIRKTALTYGFFSTKATFMFYYRVALTTLMYSLAEAHDKVLHL